MWWKQPLILGWKEKSLNSLPPPTLFWCSCGLGIITRVCSYQVSKLLRQPLASSPCNFCVHIWCILEIQVSYLLCMNQCRANSGSESAVLTASFLCVSCATVQRLQLLPFGNPYAFASQRRQREMVPAAPPSAFSWYLGVLISCWRQVSADRVGSLVV